MLVTSLLSRRSVIDCHITSCHFTLFCNPKTFITVETLFLMTYFFWTFKSLLTLYDYIFPQSWGLKQILILLLYYYYIKTSATRSRSPFMLHAPKQQPQLAGFFCAKLQKRQLTWLPCEIEALCIAAAVKHFSPYMLTLCLQLRPSEGLPAVVCCHSATGLVALNDDPLHLVGAWPCKEPQQESSGRESSPRTGARV